MLNLLLLVTAASAAIYPHPHPDPAPEGSIWESPIVLPAPRIDGSADGWAQAAAKARAFTSSLTLEEKINMTTGVGTAARCLGSTGEIPRLGFKGLCYHDSPTGVRGTDHVSVFPAGVNAAATFDKDLIFKRAVALGAEFRGKGVNFALGPGINMQRAAAAGRNWEMFGGDPYLASIGAALSVKGIQSQGVIATAKHFIANEQEHYRGGGCGGNCQTSSSNIDERTFHEVYELPFAAAVHAGVGAIMCAYNRVNQTFACQNSKLINGIIKGELNFQGPVVSDWAAPSAGVDSALAGLDVMMPGFADYGAYSEEESANPVTTTKSLWGAHLLEAVKNGSVPISRVNDMIHRNMAAYYKLKQDQDFPDLNFSVHTDDTEANEHVNVQGNHKDLIREIAGASTVVLKNADNILPLKSSLKSLGIFGLDAANDPAGPNHFVDRAGLNGTLALGWGSGTADFPYLVAPVDGIRAYLKSQKSKTKIRSVLSNSDLAAAKKAAANSDVCLVFVHANSGEGYLTVEGNQGDRNDLNLWHNGNALIKTVASVCKQTVVVAHTVGPVIVEPWIKDVKAFVSAGLPGQESGNAIADILFGLVNPSGRLPYTWAKKPSDYAAQVLYKAKNDKEIPQITYDERLLIDYRWFDAKKIAPRWEFGFGLSWSTFVYSNLVIKAPRQKRAGVQIHFGLTANSPSLWSKAVAVSFKVKNTSKVDGSEVAQLYLGYPDSAGEPIRSLRGFERVKIAAGKTASVTLTLTRKDISVYDVPSQSWMVPSGRFTVWAGASSRDLRLKGYFSQ